MLNSNHPDEERLSALASRDADATADASLATHLASCDRCAELVTELSVLRTSLAELPDLVPSRPLRFLPPVEAAHPADGVGAWVRRLFAPLVTAGAAIAMVGLVGTTAPLLGGMASSGAAPVDRQEMESAGAGGEPGAAYESSDPIHTLQSGAEAPAEDGGAVNGDDSSTERTLPAERSIWPMLLFTGVALMLGAALLRWVLVPRAG